MVQSDDLEEREVLLRHSANSYLECLEVHTGNEFALHNISRIAEELSIFYLNMHGEELLYQFIQKRCKSLAVEKNSHLATYTQDIYQYRYATTTSFTFIFASSK